MMKALRFSTMLLLLGCAWLTMPAGHAATDSDNVTFTATIPVFVALNCTSPTTTFTIGAPSSGNAATADTPTTTCVINTNDADSSVAIAFTGTTGVNNNIVTLTHTNGDDTLTVALSNPSGGLAGTDFAALTATIDVVGADQNLTFDADITDLATTTHAGVYTSSAVTITATAN
jgi:hypothetical protein